MNLQFDLPKDQSSIIKVIGVGGGGSNAVNYMYELGIRGVNYVVCNTDQQALDLSPVPNKIQLGPEITRGLGAGSRPEVGAQATIESTEEIRELLSKNTRMVFITAGMGGGTGTGGAPEVARIAKEMGILTVAIVTTPFSFEGRRKLSQADEGIEKLKENVDSIIIISNDKIREIYGNLTKSEAFSRADDILSIAAKSISEIITVPGEINVDFADVQFVMSNSGVAIMGEAQAEGENRAMRAVHAAINSPLLNSSNITGSKNILINISSGKMQATLDEIDEINNFVQDAAGNDTDIIFGTCDDDTLGDKLRVTIIATGFEEKIDKPITEKKEVINLDNQIFNTNTPEKKDNVEEIKLIDTEEPSFETSNFSDTNNMIVFDFVDEQTDDEDSLGIKDDEDNLEDNTFNFTIKEVEKEPEQKYNFYTSPSKEIKEVRDEDKNEIKHRDRIQKLKDVSYKWQNIEQLENIPAYERKGIDINEEVHSKKEHTSKFTIENFNINGEKRPEIRRDNGFLNDNID